ncbi:MAG: MATE family efflux transporter [Clostridia bacterium]|nr:MATE family efflux transporter [Clostridia bacterium]
MIRDLTKGKPSRVLWTFTLPMFLSVAFQQMYNIADSVIAGRFAGEDALAAVGASYPITMIFNAIAAGSNIGCAVVIARIFGSGDYKKLRTAVSTTVISSVVISIVLMLAGVFTSAPMTALLNTPENIFGDAALYLKIYIGGFVFLFLYNIATAVFVSLGDSRTPLVFLICSSVGNIILDYVFVRFFSWGVAGVAWATFIAQGTACVFALVFVRIRIRSIPAADDYRRFSGEMLKEICRVALPSILQQSFVSVGNLFIQSLVNSFGSSVIAGYSSAIKLNTFCITNLTTLGNGVSSYTAQNVGAGRKDRIEAGFSSSLLISLVITVPFSVLYYFFASPFVGLFMEHGGGEAMQIGVRFLHLVSPFYVFISAKIMVDGILRGMGKMKIFLVSTFADLIIRVILAYILSPYYGTDGIWYSWPVGWMAATLLSVLFFLVIRKKEIINQ